MDLREGIKLSEGQLLQTTGADLQAIARRGAEIFLEMIFRDGFYHADPHPGNLLVLPGGVIGILDCGMVGRLDERMREEIEEMILALVTGDAQTLATILARLGSLPASADLAGWRADVADYLSYYTGQSLDRFDLGKALTELIELIRRYGIILPTGVALLFKVLIMLEGTSRLLSPRFNLVELMQPYQQKLLWRRLSPTKHFQRFRRLYREWEYLAEVFPRGATDLLQQIQAGKFSVHLEHQRLEPSVNRLVWGMITSALFLGSSLLWSHEVPPLLGGVSVFGVTGCVLSLLLSLRLLRAIRKSGYLDR